MEDAAHALLDIVREGQVVFDRVKAPQHGLEYAYLNDSAEQDQISTRQKPQAPCEVKTYVSSQLVVEFFDDYGKGATSLIKEMSWIRDHGLLL
jgi:hypothetical protein